MADQERIARLAGEAYDWFETATRVGSDETFDRLKDGRPEWLQELVREAHGEFLPDDWRYSAIRSALAWIHDNDGNDESGEFADSEVDVYNAARVKWLGSHINRGSYCDEAASEFGYNEEQGVYGLIGMGQYLEAGEVFGSVYSQLAAIVDEEQDEEAGE